MYVCSNHIFFYFFNVWRTMHFFKKRDDHGFLSYQALFICKKNSSRRWCLLVLGLVKNSTFSYKWADFSIIVNISVKTLWCHAIDTIFAFFLFIYFPFLSNYNCFCLSYLTWSVMFKDSNGFEFTNSPLKNKV